MTVQESTICGLVQTFPILLILAQNHNRCLKTPLIYKPPTPTPSPEYYEALDALFQNIFGHGAHGHGHEPHGCIYGGVYGYGKKYPHSTSPCYTGHGVHDISHHGHGSYPTVLKPSYPSVVQPSYPTVHHGLSSYPSYGYSGYPGYGYSGNPSYGYSGYPSYGYKKVSASNVSGGQGHQGTYAPTQVYNLNHKYKVVIKKNKKRKPHKLQLQQSTEQCEVQGRQGKCVALRDCEPYVTVLLQQQGKSNPALTQFFRKAHCGFEGKQPKVCCLPQRQRNPNYNGSSKSAANITVTTEQTATEAVTVVPDDSEKSQITENPGEFENTDSISDSQD